MKNYSPVINVETSEGGLIILADGAGSFLVQDVVTKFVTETNDENAIADYIAEILRTHGISETHQPEEPSASSTVVPAKEEPIVRSEVDSSFIRMLEYDKRFRTMTVYMHSGSWYCYEDVPMYVYEDMLERNRKGGSVGGYYNRYIKNNFQVSVFVGEPRTD